MTDIPDYIVRDSLELTRVLAQPEGQLFLRVLEREVTARVTKILQPETTDEEAIRERHVIMAVTGMVEHELLTPMRLAQGWMAKRSSQGVVR